MTKVETIKLYKDKGLIVVNADQKREFLKRGFSEKPIEPVNADKKKPDKPEK